MCQEWPTLADGTKIRCRKCELCLFNKVKDWAGRNIAQSKVSTKSFAITLTYGPELDEKRMPIPGRSDHIRTAVLTYSDVQDFFKYLRWQGYKFAYFVTGEFGSLKGRAHWHVILHFRGKVPSHELSTDTRIIRFSDRHVNDAGKLFNHEVCKAWPHGFMQWKPARYEHVFYNCKYILKDEGDEAAQRKPQPSKKPPLGALYFQKVAEQAVKQGLAPQSLKYTFPEIRNRETGQLIEFELSGRSAELYLEHFIKVWARERPEQVRPNSPLVDLFEEYGQVVYDEAKLLAKREEMEHGRESKERFPTSAEWQRHKRDVADKRESDEWKRILLRAEDYIGKTSDGEERQKRQIEFEQLVHDDEHRRFQKLHQSGKVWQFGKGWFQSGEEFCECEWYGCLRKPYSSSPRSGEGAKPQSGEPGWLGKIGKINRDYRGQ